jgi:hypothetical protein
VAPLVEGKSIDDVGNAYEGDVVGSDPATAYDESAEVAAAAFKKRKAVLPDPDLLYDDKVLDAGISTTGRLLHTGQLK